MALTYQENIRIEDYLALRDAVQWPKLCYEQAQASLEGSAYVVSCYDGEKIAGTARVLWDGGYIAYLADVMVMPQYQGQGIGRHMVEMIKAYLRAQKREGWILKLNLVATKGREVFYRKLGFQDRPREHDGAGMDQWL